MRRVKKGFGGGGSLFLRNLGIAEDEKCYGTRSELELLEHYFKFRLDKKWILFYSSHRIFFFIHQRKVAFAPPHPPGNGISLKNNFKILPCACPQGQAKPASQPSAPGSCGKASSESPTPEPLPHSSHSNQMQHLPQLVPHLPIWFHPWTGGTYPFDTNKYGISSSNNAATLGTQNLSSSTSQILSVRIIDSTFGQCFTEDQSWNQIWKPDFWATPVTTSEY